MFLTNNFSHSKTKNNTPSWNVPSDASQLSKIFPEVDMVFGNGQKLSLSPENYLFRVRWLRLYLVNNKRQFVCCFLFLVFLAYFDAPVDLHQFFVSFYCQWSTQRSTALIAWESFIMDKMQQHFWEVCFIWF